MLCVSATDAIARVKEETQGQEGIGATDQCVFFRGKQFEDGCTLATCHIQKEATLHLVKRMNGGNGKRVVCAWGLARSDFRPVALVSLIVFLPRC